MKKLSKIELLKRVQRRTRRMGKPQNRDLRWMLVNARQEKLRGDTGGNGHA